MTTTSTPESSAKSATTAADTNAEQNQEARRTPVGGYILPPATASKQPPSSAPDSLLDSRAEKQNSAIDSNQFVSIDKDPLIYFEVYHRIFDDCPSAFSVPASALLNTERHQFIPKWRQSLMPPLILKILRSFSSDHSLTDPNHVLDALESALMNDNAKQCLTFSVSNPSGAVPPRELALYDALVEALNKGTTPRVYITLNNHALRLFNTLVAPLMSSLNVTQETEVETPLQQSATSSFSQVTSPVMTRTSSAPSLDLTGLAENLYNELAPSFASREPQLQAAVASFIQGLEGPGPGSSRPASRPLIPDDLSSDSGGPPNRPFASAPVAWRRSLGVPPRSPIGTPAPASAPDLARATTERTSGSRRNYRPQVSASTAHHLSSRLFSTHRLSGQFARPPRSNPSSGYHPQSTSRFLPTDPDDPRLQPPPSYPGPAGHNEDQTPWDSQDRGGFHYPPSSPGEVAAIRGPDDPLILKGTHWYCYHVDPQDMAADNTTIVDPHTQQIYPWLAMRYNFGEVVNHAVQLNISHFDRQSFLAQFRTGSEFSNSQYKYFTSSFPVFSGNNDDLLPFLSNVCSFAHSHKIFVPPPHTYREEQVLGTWFDELDERTQSMAANQWDQLLLAILRDKRIKMHENDSTKAIVTSETTSGYRVLYLLAALGGHPLLVARPPNLVQPRQREDQTVASYNSKWMRFLLLSALHGTHYSDRYYFHEFKEGLHGSLKILKDYLREQETHWGTSDRVNIPLPARWSPASMLTSLHQYALSVGSMSLLSTSPREHSNSRRNPLAVRELIEHVDWPAPAATSPPAAFVNAISTMSTIPADPLSEEEEDMFLCLAISSGSGTATACFFCGQSGHMLTQCPAALRARKSEYGRRAIRKFMETNSGSNHSSPNRPQAREITSDDATVPTCNPSDFH